MRTSLFLTTLFAAAPIVLTGGAALADKTHDGSAAREPRVVEQLRSHGDIVDKVYNGTVERTERGAPQVNQEVGQAKRAKPPTAGQARLDPAASRINCSDTGADCASHGSGRGPAGAAVGDASAGGRVGRVPAFFDKILGNDRTNFNEAGEPQGMSARSANRMWARSAAEHRSAGVATPLAPLAPVDRISQQASDVRMSCDDGDECYMSSKGARKMWAKASIKAGTWTGPAPEPVSNATLRINAQRAAEGATAPKAAHGTEGRPAAAGSEAAHEE